MKVSVVIPTYNRRSCIGNAIDSVLIQQRPDIEILVVDDGSTDGTLEWIDSAYKDCNVRAIRNFRSKGPAGARNSGISEATGDIIALLDSDDAFLPEHIAHSIDVLKSDSQVSVVFGRAVYEQAGSTVDYMGPNFDKKLALASVRYENEQFVVFDDDYSTHLLEQGCYFNLSTVVLRAGAAQKLMNESLRIAEDYEFWVRLAREFGFACLKTPQIRYQLHEENISFESDGDPAGNAPMLLTAHNIILAYPDLSGREAAIVRRHISEIYFDWAYRCRSWGRLAGALKLHLQSMRYGLVLRNFWAMLKLPLG